LQFGWHPTQLNRIGNLRSSSVTPARAELPSVVTEPGTMMQRATAPSSAQPRTSNDLTSLKLVPSPSPGYEQRQRPHNSTPHDSVMQAS
jgi:hypothetical protein